jgi:hypothetical protein
MIPPETQPSSFNPLDPAQWASLFAKALLGGTPQQAAAPLFGQITGTGQAANYAPNGSPLDLMTAFQMSQPSTGAPGSARPPQGQGLAPQDTYGGDEYAHAGWGTAQPYDYSHPQPHVAAHPHAPNTGGGFQWPYLNLGWLAALANQPGYHVGGHY